MGGYLDTRASAVPVFRRGVLGFIESEDVEGFDGAVFGGHFSGSGYSSSYDCSLYI